MALLTPELAPHHAALAAAVASDLVLGDPTYPAHPVRLIGRALSSMERGLRAIGADGYGGGVALFAGLGALAVGTCAGLVVGTAAWVPPAAWALHVFFLYSFIALGDLLHHAGRVERALQAGDLDTARAAAGRLVGRDVERMDAAACRRAAIESLGESLTDGFVSAIFWYALAGLPGLVLFKVVSTMDSMVGFKTPGYVKLGWCGARLDDVMNYVPARLTWLLIALVAMVVPGASGAGAWRVGWQQHGVLPSPNSGWPEAALAGAIRRRLAGPIWLRGQLVTDIWIGAPDDPPAETREDFLRARTVVVIAGVLSAALAALLLAAVQ